MIVRATVSAEKTCILSGQNQILNLQLYSPDIYDGVPNWRSTDAVCFCSNREPRTSKFALINPNSQERFCVLASLSGSSGHLEVKREDRFFSGHRQVDDYYHFGFRWVAGHK